METNNLKSYQVRLQCQKCHKFIDVDLYFKITERDQYGKSEEFWPTKLPEYLKEYVFGAANRIYDKSFMQNRQPQASPLWSNAFAGQPTSINQQKNNYILCQECVNLEKLKE